MRPEFAGIRVVVTGSECTGKTTLAAALAAHYGTAWVPEYAREYVAAKSGPVDASDVDAIARGQIESENRFARDAHRILIQDTDLISTVVYSRHYFGHCPNWIEDAARDRRADLYLLAGIDVPWAADGIQRDRGDRRDEMQELFRNGLREYGAAFVEIRGALADRRTRSIRAIDRLLGAPQAIERDRDA